MINLAKPNISGEVKIAAEAIVIGSVTIGRESSVWYHAVVRGDVESIEIGHTSNIQDGVVVHADPGFPVKIGNETTIGHNATIHGCLIGDRTVIGMGSIILNGATIGNECMIGAGSLVTGNMVIPDGMLVMGSPAKVIRPLTDSERKQLKQVAEEYSKLKEVVFSAP